MPYISTKLPFDIGNIAHPFKQRADTLAGTDRENKKALAKNNIQARIQNNPDKALKRVSIHVVSA